MNPFTMLKYKSQLEGNHPKAAEFVKRVILTGLPEVKKPRLLMLK